ncbi:MAG: single-stranded DNA-binding protein [Gloeobacterales cyanobacterium]
MNAIAILGEVVSDPELRETPDGLAIAKFPLRFAAARPEEAPYQVSVVVFGRVARPGETTRNLAQEVAQQFHQGDTVVVEGQLRMNTIEREGYKEKRAEVQARKVVSVSAGAGEFSVQESAASPPPKAASKPAAERRVAPPKPPVNLPSLEEDELPF